VNITVDQFKDWMWQPCIHDYVGMPKHWTIRKRDCDKCIAALLDQPTPEFCLSCGAGIGKFRRDGEGTCPKCDPIGVTKNAKNKI